jgi:hypothetical protein
MTLSSTCLIMFLLSGFLSRDCWFIYFSIVSRFLRSCLLLLRVGGGQTKESPGTKKEVEKPYLSLRSRVVSPTGCWSVGTPGRSGRNIFLSYVPLLNGSDISSRRRHLVPSLGLQTRQVCSSATADTSTCLLSRALFLHSPHLTQILETIFN